MDQGGTVVLKNYYFFNLIEKLVEEDANFITLWKTYYYKRRCLFSIEAWDTLK